jgi:hypothetical protein
MPGQARRRRTRNRDLLILLVLPGLVALAAAAEPIIALLFGASGRTSPVRGLDAPWRPLVMRRLFAQVALNVLGRSETNAPRVAAEGRGAIAMLVLFTPWA